MNLRSLFLRHVAQTSDAPMLLEIERGKGVNLFDSAGKSYMDLISGISVSNLGHAHPEVVKAIQEQSVKYAHTLVYGEFVMSPQVQLAEFLSKLLPNTLDVTYFTNSGSEAVEGAVKLAKKYTGRANTISCKNAYHGSSHGAMSLMGSETFKQGYRPLVPGNTIIEFNNYDDLDCIDKNVACVIMEVVQGEAGVILPLSGYLQAVRERCKEVGALLIFDEIQTGLGRTGKMFAFEHYNVVPDILLLAKSLGAGLPLGAFISSREIMKVLSHDPPLGHITTFGGNAICCAAALAALKVVCNKKLYEAEIKAQRFLKALSHPAIEMIRHKGLFMAIQLDSFENVKAVIHQALEQGLIIDWFLFANDCLRLVPPLIISEEEIDLACKKLNLSLSEVYG